MASLPLTLHCSSLPVPPPSKLRFERLMIAGPAPSVSNFVGATLVEPNLGIWSGGLIFQSYKANPPKEISESTFEQPCVPKPGGFSLPAQAKDPFAELGLVIGGEPRWFHVLPTTRCTSGMVFAINPTWPQTYEAFKAKAMERNDSSPAPSSSPNLTSSSASISVQKFTGSLAGMMFVIHFIP